MRYCKHCGHPLKEGALFCSECGKPVGSEKKTEQQPTSPSEHQQAETNTESRTTLNKTKKPLFQSKNSKIIATILAIIAVILIGSYFTINKMIMSPEAVSKNFIQAVMDKDADAVKKFINDGQLEMNATKKDAENFIQFLHDQPRMITQIKDQLSYDARIIARDKSYAGDWESIVSMRYNGKKWLVFDHYVVQVLPVYLTVTSSEDNTSIVLGDKEAGKITDADTPETFGPFLPGVYEVKAVVDGEYGKAELVEKVDFTALTETEKDLDFDFASFYLDLYTDNPDAIVFVNGKSTGKTVQEMDPFGPVKLDGSVEIYAQKEFVTGVRKSTPVVIDENTYDINLYIGYDDYDEQYDIETKRTEELRAMAEEEQAIMDTIYNHYRRISNDDFESAYQLFSKNMKKKFDVDGWAKGLEPNLRDDVTTIDVEEIDGNKAVAYIEMTSYDDNGDGTVTAKKWKGNWNLVKEDGQWRLDSTSIDIVDSWKE